MGLSADITPGPHGVDKVPALILQAINHRPTLVVVAINQAGAQTAATGPAGAEVVTEFYQRVKLILAQRNIVLLGNIIDSRLKGVNQKVLQQ